MKVTFLGTNGWYDTETGNTTCVLVDTEEFHIVLDAGNGIHKLDRYILDDKPIYLFLSHPHLDHIIGLHTMNKFRFRQGMTIIGQPGTKALLDTVIGSPFSVPLRSLPFRVDVQELTEGMHSVPFRMACRFLVHSTPCYGYRFEVDGKVLAFCTDTGVCDNIVRLGRDADLLITECSFKPGESNPNWPHLNPGEALEMAKLAGAKRLALVHFDAMQYKRSSEREDAVVGLSEGSLEIIVSRDGMQIDV